MKPAAEPAAGRASILRDADMPGIVLPIAAEAQIADGRAVIAAMLAAPAAAAPPARERAR